MHLKSLHPRPSRFPILVRLLKWVRKYISRIALVVILLYLVSVFYLSSVLDSKHSQHGIIRNHAAAAAAKASASIPHTTADRASVSTQDFMPSATKHRVLPITAYLEQPIFNSRGFPFNSTKARSFQQRNIQPGPLQKIVYNTQQLTCSTLQVSLPVDHPRNLDIQFGGTSGKFQSSLYENRQEYAKCCTPVDYDPWLPWIHDIFVQGQHVEFIAHNRRRCRTDPKQSMVDMLNLEPQVALLQSVPIKRVYPYTAGDTHNKVPPDNTTHRYKLSTLEDADEDGKETRFVCRFHRLEQRGGKYKRAILGETLSVYPYNYEATHARRPGKSPLLSYPDDELSDGTAHNDHVWNSILHFRCPIPEALQAKLAGSVVNDIPSIYVDVVPIRTPVRLLRSGYFPQNTTDLTFDPYKEWDMENLLPDIESSGRWENLPLCPISETVSKNKYHIDVPSAVHANKRTEHESISQSQAEQMRYNLVACTWTSTTSQPRGNAHIDDSNKDRLLEWLIYQLYIANFDHIYVYDNSVAQDNADNSSLADIINIFPANRVTRIEWPHRICNNNRPMHQNPGERSSQYAAETSCRVRYGPSTKWMAFFDIDEYFITTSKWKDLQDWLAHGVNEESKILSFFQTRAKPNANLMEAYYSTVMGSPEQRACGDSISNSRCLSKRSNTTFLETYNCDYTRLPKPPYAYRAKKQIYQPSFVLNHFVHYSTVTQRAIDFPDERVYNYVQRSPYERRVNELTEAFMLHAKTTFPVSTEGWRENCATAEGLKKNRCSIGIPFNGFSTSPLTAEDSDGGLHNCFPHQRIQELVAVLETKLQKFKEMQ